MGLSPSGCGAGHHRCQFPPTFDLEYCFVYVDDMLIGSKSQEEHLQQLREVLSRLEEHGIVLNSEKCMLGVPEAVLRIRIRGIRIISLDPDPYQKMAGSGIQIRIK